MDAHAKAAGANQPTKSTKAKPHLRHSDHDCPPHESQSRLIRARNINNFIIIINSLLACEVLSGYGEPPGSPDGFRIIAIHNDPGQRGPVQSLVLGVLLTLSDCWPYAARSRGVGAIAAV